MATSKAGGLNKRMMGKLSKGLSNASKNAGNARPHRNYVKNIAKSLGLASIDVVKELNPVITEALSSNTSYVKEQYGKLREVTDTANGITSSKYNQMAKNIFKNALSELKSGNIYTKEKQQAVMDTIGESIGIDKNLLSDFDNAFSDMDMDSESGDMASSSNEEHDSFFDEETDSGSGEGGSTTSIKQTTNNMSKFTTMNVVVGGTSNKIGNATNSILVAHSKAVLQMTQQSTATLITGISAITKFQEENTLKFYNDVSDKLADIGSGIQTMSKIYANQYTEEYKSALYKDMSNIMYNGLQIQTYMDRIKDKAKNSDLGDMAKMIPGIISGFAENPLGSALKGGMKALLPKSIKGAFARMNETAENLPIMFQYLLQGMETDGTLKGKLKGKMKDFFGLGDMKPKMNNGLGNYEKGAVAYNGKADRALTFVIPDLLGKILTTLKGQDDSKQLTYDYESGYFTTLEGQDNKNKADIKDTITKNVGEDIQSVLSEFDPTEITEELQQQVVQAFEKAVMSGKSFRNMESGSISDNEKIEKTIRKIAGDAKTGGRIEKNLFNATAGVQQKYDSISTGNDLASVALMAGNTAEREKMIAKEREKAQKEYQKQMLKNAKERQKVFGDYDYDNTHGIGGFFNSVDKGINYGMLGNRAKADESLGNIKGYNEVKNAGKSVYNSASSAVNNFKESMSKDDSILNRAKNKVKKFSDRASAKFMGQAVDDNGNPLVDENGNPIYTDANNRNVNDNGVTRHAKGGFIRRPTMTTLGEEGEEAVVPMSERMKNKASSMIHSISDRVLGPAKRMIGSLQAIVKAPLKWVKNTANFGNTLANMLVVLSGFYETYCAVNGVEVGKPDDGEDKEGKGKKKKKGIISRLTDAIVSPFKEILEPFKKMKDTLVNVKNTIFGNEKEGKKNILGRLTDSITGLKDKAVGLVENAWIKFDDMKKGVISNYNKLKEKFKAKKDKEKEEGKEGFFTKLGNKYDKGKELLKKGLHTAGNLASGAIGFATEKASQGASWLKSKVTGLKGDKARKGFRRQDVYVVGGNLDGIKNVVSVTVEKKKDLNAGFKSAMENSDKEQAENENEEGSNAKEAGSANSEQEKRKLRLRARMDAYIEKATEPVRKMAEKAKEKTKNLAINGVRAVGNKLTSISGGKGVLGKIGGKLGSFMKSPDAVKGAGMTPVWVMGDNTDTSNSEGEGTRRSLGNRLKESKLGQKVINSKLGQTIKDKAETAWIHYDDAKKNIASRVKSGATKLKDSAVNSAKNIKEDVKSTAKSAVDTGRGLVDKAKTKWNSEEFQMQRAMKREDMIDKLTTLRENAKGKLEIVQTQIREKFKMGKEIVREKFKTVASAAREKIKGIWEKLGPKLSAGMEVAGGAIKGIAKAASAIPVAGKVLAAVAAVAGIGLVGALAAKAMGTVSAKEPDEGASATADVSSLSKKNAGESKKAEKSLKKADDKAKKEQKKKKDAEKKSQANIKDKSANKGASNELKERAQEIYDTDEKLQILKKLGIQGKMQAKVIALAKAKAELSREKKNKSALSKAGATSGDGTGDLKEHSKYFGSTATKNIGDTAGTLSVLEVRARGMNPVWLMGSNINFRDGKYESKSDKEKTAKKLKKKDTAELEASKTNKEFHEYTKDFLYKMGQWCNSVYKMILHIATGGGGGGTNSSGSSAGVSASGSDLVDFLSVMHKEEMGGKGPGYVASALNDGAGKNYGAYSFTERYTLKPFVAWLKETYPELGEQLTAEPASSAFDSQWEALGEKEPDKFLQAQARFITENTVVPAIQKIKDATGVDLDSGKYSMGVLGLLASTAHQRPAWVNEKWIPFLKAHPNASSNEIIDGIAGDLANNYNGVYADSIRNRYKREQEAHKANSKNFSISQAISGGGSTTNGSSSGSTASSGGTTINGSTAGGASSSGSTASAGGTLPAEQAFVQLANKLNGKTKYSQAKRNQLEEFGDCSSTVDYMLETATNHAVDITPDGQNRANTTVLEASPLGQVVWKQGDPPLQESQLRPGDTFHYNGHVDAYIGDGKKFNNGGGGGLNDLVPAHIDPWNNRNDITMVKRWIAPGMTGQGGSGSGSLNGNGQNTTLDTNELYNPFESYTGSRRDKEDAKIAKEAQDYFDEQLLDKKFGEGMYKSKNAIAFGDKSKSNSRTGGGFKGNTSGYSGSGSSAALSGMGNNASSSTLNGLKTGTIINTVKDNLINNPDNIFTIPDGQGGSGSGSGDIPSGGGSSGGSGGSGGGSGSGGSDGGGGSTADPSNPSNDMDRFEYYRKVLDRLKEISDNTSGIATTNELLQQIIALMLGGSGSGGGLFGDISPDISLIAKGI